MGASFDAGWMGASFDAGWMVASFDAGWMAAEKRITEWLLAYGCPECDERGSETICCDCGTHTLATIAGAIKRGDHRD